MTKAAAIYTRVSSDRQKEDHTIASQTAALIEYAQTHSYVVPAEWVFQDEGYSGATLIRPGLEALRDLAAQGQIVAVLVYSPDRLSRKYAYQVLLAEEFSRCGVELVFLKSPAGTTPEDQLVVQFQGMIAEYERTQIAERSRRGKRHKAQQGVVNVLSGAPYGYRYVKKSDVSAAYYEVIEAEAQVVRLVFAMYTQQQLSINAIARQLNRRGISTRTGKTRWERSTVWGILRNPAYQGKACYGKTERRPRQRITRPLRQRNRLPTRDSANHERPRQDWIEVSVPALVHESVFALAQEQLQKNKHFSPRRTKKPTLLQGILICQQCGYAMYRSSGGKTQRPLYYYRCLGSDGYRRLHGALCTNRPVRQDYLDQLIWAQIIALLENEKLIQSEIDRRKGAAHKTDPRQRRKEILRSEQARLTNKVERLITAYQEGLLTLEQLRERMPNLKQHLQATESELQSLEMAKLDEAKYLKLAESLSGFRKKLRARAETLDVKERQQILRLLVKEILIGSDTLIIRHSVPIPHGDGGPSAPSPPNVPGSTPSQPPGYRLCTRSNFTAPRKHLPALRFRSLGERLAPEVGARRSGGHPIRR
jgi:site-specific DNA recombinase